MSGRSVACGAVAGPAGDAGGRRRRAARCAPALGRAAATRSAAVVTSTGGAGVRQHEGSRSAGYVGIERQVGAAGLEDAEQPDHHLERALDAQPHHGLGPDPERAQMMRQLVGARIELAIAQAVARSQTSATASGRARRLRGEQLRQRRAPATGRAVSFHSVRMVWRSSADRMSRLPIGAIRRRATAAASSRTSRSRQRLDAAAIKQVGGIFQHALRSRPASPSAARCSARLTDRSNFALALATGFERRPQPGKLKAQRRRVVLERQHHLEQRMPRQRPRRVEHLHQPLERQLLMRRRPQGCRARTRASSSRKLGLPEVSVRSTSVLTKNPTRSSSALSVRPAIGLPIGMSVPAPSRVSSAASPACSTMNRLAPLVARQPQQGRHAARLDIASATLPPRWLATAGRGRSLGSVKLLGQPRQRSASSTPSCRAIALLGSSSSPSTSCCHSV